MSLLGCVNNPENLSETRKNKQLKSSGYNVLRGALEDVLPTLDLSKYVVYISCVLEYVSDLQLIMSYLNQVPPENML